MTWKGMQREMDSEELMYQMALDAVEAAEQAGKAPAPSAGPEPRWIAMDDPDFFTKLKERLGMR